MITNYDQYKEIPSKTMRFEALARLVSSKTARQCYERASLLKLKKNDMDLAKKISEQLHMKDEKAEVDSKVAKSFKKLCEGLLADKD